MNGIIGDIIHVSISSIGVIGGIGRICIISRVGIGSIAIICNIITIGRFCIGRFYFVSFICIFLRICLGQVVLIFLIDIQWNPDQVLEIIIKQLDRCCSVSIFASEQVIENGVVGYEHIQLCTGVFEVFYQHLEASEPFVEDGIMKTVPAVLVVSQQDHQFDVGVLDEIADQVMTAQKNKQMENGSAKEVSSGQIVLGEFG